jgi:hypothetical protein
LGIKNMVQAIRRLFTAGTSKDDRRVARTSPAKDKGLLQAKLLAVAIARASDYADPTRWS